MTLYSGPAYESEKGSNPIEIYTFSDRSVNIIIGLENTTHMRIIPVLDLMDGLVVHGFSGERERYQPVRSILAANAEPLEVARGLQAATKSSTFYIADLDAIQGKGHNRLAIDEIASNLDVELWVDAGVTDAGSAKRLIQAGADVIVIGSETLSALQQLRSICRSVPRDRIVFSLDLVGWRVLSRTETLKGMTPSQALACLIAEGLDRFILLTLDAVGTGDGPDLSLFQAARHEYPGHQFIAGGGVKTPDHLQALLHAGMDGVLVATSLHRGWISRRDLVALK